MKKYIRTLFSWPQRYKQLWRNAPERERLRSWLNEDGFYVLHGDNDSLEVFAIEDWREPWDIRFLKWISREKKDE